MNIREADIKCRGNGRSEIRRMTSGRMDDDMPDTIRQKRRKKKPEGLARAKRKKESSLNLPLLNCI